MDAMTRLSDKVTSMMQFANLRFGISVFVKFVVLINKRNNPFFFFHVIVSECLEHKYGIVKKKKTKYATNQ